MAIQKHVYNVGTGNAIYAETDNINYFLSTPLAPASAGSIVDKTSNVKGFTRRRYVGDTAASNVSATTRDYLFDPGRRNGAATPGKPFILDDGTEKRQFTYTGSFTDLHAFLLIEIKMDCTLYSPSASYQLLTIS